jgi:hypothetical protein
MGEAIRAAEARLRAEMARARDKYAVRWTIRSYVLPIGLMAGGLLISAAMGPPPTGALMPASPLITAAVFSRVFGGITAARVAAAIALPIVIYMGVSVGAVWYWGEVAALIGLCIERASCARYGLAPPRRSAPHRAHMPLAFRAPKP